MFDRIKKYEKFVEIYRDERPFLQLELYLPEYIEEYYRKEAEKEKNNKNGVIIIDLVGSDDE